MRKVDVNVKPASARKIATPQPGKLPALQDGELLLPPDDLGVDAPAAVLQLEPAPKKRVREKTSEQPSAAAARPEVGEAEDPNPAPKKQAKAKAKRKPMPEGYDWAKHFKPLPPLPDGVVLPKCSKCRSKKGGCATCRKKAGYTVEG